jgi:hypothetical protein
MPESLVEIVPVPESRSKMNMEYFKIEDRDMVMFINSPNPSPVVRTAMDIIDYINTIAECNFVVFGM